MSKISKNVKRQAIVSSLEYRLISQGKVRDIYELPNDSDLLLVVTSDRISIFDFVLPVTIPRKGEILTALKNFWLREVIKTIDHDLMPAPARPYRNYATFLKRNYPDVLLERSLVVEKLDILPFEMIFRAHIGGSVWKEYREKGTAGGQKLPAGLTKWSRLEHPVFTPSTKAAAGHDVNVTADYFFKQLGRSKEGAGDKAFKLCQTVYQQGYNYAKERGIVILDTKFEVGKRFDLMVIADEVLTPDSSRFTTAEDLKQALQEGRDPIFYDKEPVRIWGKGVKTPFTDSAGKEIVGINKLDPVNPIHLAFVQSLTVPPEVVEQCSLRYQDIFQRLVGTTLDEYQQKNLL